MKKLLIATALLGCTALNVNATAIPANIIYNDGSIVSSVIAELNFNYESQSVVTDQDGSFGISAGDTIKSVGGASLYNGDVNPAALADFTAPANLGNVLDYNFLTSTPGSALPDYGFGQSWIMSLSLTNFSGTFVDGVGVGGAGALIYDQGDITLYGLHAAADDGIWTSVEELHTYSILSNSIQNGGINYTLQVTDVENDHFSDTVTGDTFGNNLGNQKYTFGNILQTTKIPAIESTNVVNGKLEITLAKTSHDGDMVYSVPEPTSIAILGLGLLGFAGASRRKAK
jgi:hypothetical protein